MERKTYSAFETKIADGDQGVVETIFAVMGNLDDGDDVLHPGAFTKTLADRGHKVKVLDQHRTESVLGALGKPLEIRELSSRELPPIVTDKYPEATGAMWAKVQFLLSTPEGKGAFERIKAGLIDSWSFGYDAAQVDYGQVQRKDGTIANARHLRQVKLYELSPVLFGMNPATATLSAKSAPAEGKPWRAVRGDDGKWRVYKLDGDGQPTGEPLGEHEDEEQAQAQVRALYANEGGKAAQPTEPIEAEGPEAPTKAGDTPGEQKVGRVIAKRNAERLTRALAELNEVLKDAGLLEVPEDDAPEQDAAAGKAGSGPQAEPPTPRGAGPDAEAPEYRAALANLCGLELDILALQTQTGG